MSCTGMALGELSMQYSQYNEQIFQILLVQRSYWHRYRRMPDQASLVSSPSEPRTVSIGPGHLGVTLSDHALGVRVDRAHEPDAIYQAGIRVGDVLVAIDGIAVSHHATACDLLGSNVNKPIVLAAGPHVPHEVQYYPAGALAAVMRKRYVSPLSIAQQLFASESVHTNGDDDGLRTPGGQPAIRLMVLAVLIALVYSAIGGSAPSASSQPGFSQVPLELESDW